MCQSVAERRAEDLSEGAQKIVDIIGLEGNVSTIVEDHPELVAFLDEYVEWRDETNEAIGSETDDPKVAHGLKDDITAIISDLTHQ